MLSSASIMAHDHPHHQHNHQPQQSQQPPQQQALKQQQQQQQQQQQPQPQQQQQQHQQPPQPQMQQAQHLQPNQPQSNPRAGFAFPLLSRRCYTGVDKLLMAAMMDEAAVAAAPGARGYLPSGRGLGYFGQARDTHCQIPTPSNKSELELYRLLERANLLIYFGTFLNFGGDDVQQLSDANEEEFLEIMSLVGMTQKPLHVRRLQKALIEWRENRDYESSAYHTSHHRHHHHHQLHQQQAPPPAQRHHLSHQHQVAQIPMGGGPAAAVSCSDTGSSQANASSTSNRLLFHPPSVESPTPSMRSTNTSVANNDTSQDQPAYILPHELLVGAPKRIRLMDSFHVRLGNPDHSPCKSDRSSLLHHADDSSDQLLTSSPKSHRGHDENDKEDDKFIEVMDSSLSE